MLDHWQDTPVIWQGRSEAQHVPGESAISRYSGIHLYLGVQIQLIIIDSKIPTRGPPFKWETRLCRVSHLTVVPRVGIKVCAHQLQVCVLPSGVYLRVCTFSCALIIQCWSHLTVRVCKLSLMCMLPQDMHVTPCVHTALAVHATSERAPAHLTSRCGDYVRVFSFKYMSSVPAFPYDIW